MGCHTVTLGFAAGLTVTCQAASGNVRRRKASKRSRIARSTYRVSLAEAARVKSQPTYKLGFAR